MPRDLRLCRRHYSLGVKAVRNNPNYRKLSRERRRKIAAAVGWSLEKIHGRHHCEGRVLTVRL